MREGRNTTARLVIFFTGCASFRDRILRLCSIRDGVNRGNRRRHAAIAAITAAAARCRLYRYTRRRAGIVGKTFPKAQFPRSASEPSTFTSSAATAAAARIDRPLQQLPIYVHPAHNARKVHVRPRARLRTLARSLLWKATGKKRARVELGRRFAVTYGRCVVTRVRGRESSKLRGACRTA